MSKHTLYAYVDGADLDTVAPALEARLIEFVAGRSWTAGEAWVVNQRHGRDTRTPPDLELWDLGLNLHLPDPGSEPPQWFVDVEDIARFLGVLHAEFARDFIIGIANNETGICDDLLDISTPSPDLTTLAAILGIVQRDAMLQKLGTPV